MGSVIVGETKREIELGIEFDRLRAQVVKGLKEGTVASRHGPVDAFWDTARRLRSWRFRKVDITRPTSGVWTSFGVHYPGEGLDVYDIYFVSSKGELGSFVGYTSKGCYVTTYQGVSGEKSLERWIGGLKVLLGVTQEDTSMFSVNPA